MSADDLKILDLREAATQLHSCVSFVRTIIGAGELSFLKIGKKFCVTQGDLNAWIQRARGHHGDADSPRTKGKERGKQTIKVVKSA